MIYDVPHLDGHPLLDVPYRERRERLDDLGLSGPRWQTAPWYPGDGGAVLEAARDQGLPGVVAKRLDSPTSRARSPAPGGSSRRGPGSGADPPPVRLTRPARAGSAEALCSGRNRRKPPGIKRT